MSQKEEQTQIIDQLKKELSFNELIVNQSLHASGIIVSNSNKEHNIIQPNQTFLSLTGLKREVFPIPIKEGFKFLINFDPSFIQSFLDKDDKQQTKILVSGKNKTFKLYLVKALPYLVFFIEDISQSIELKEELFEKKMQLIESQKMAHLGYWIQNHEAGKHLWSDEVYSILGIAPNELVPSFDAYLAFVHPHDKDAVESTFYEALHNKTGYELTHRVLLKNNVIKYVNQRCYTNYNDYGEPLQTVGIVQDTTAMEQTRKHLRESEEKFRSVFDHAPIAIVLVNKATKPILSNNQFCQITGYNIKEINRKGLDDFTHPDDVENNLELYHQLFANKTDNFTLTKRYIKKNGQTIWVKATVSAVKNEKNQAEMAIAMIQDITAEKKATRELIKSEYKYRTLIENANDGIGLFDMDFKPIIYNTALYKMLGYELNEYLKIDHKKFELFHPDDVQDARKALDKIKNREKAKIEKRLKNKDGNYQYFSINYIPVIHEEKPAILIFRRDISQRKMAEQQNEEYRLFLETLMENLPISLFAKTTPDFRYLYWNRALEKLTGITAENALGKTDHELMQFRKDADQYLKEDQQLLKRKHKLESEHEFTNTLGEIKQFNTIKTLHESTVGNPVVLGISMDITRLKEAEKQVEQSTQMLKEAQKIAKLGYWEYDVEKDLFFDNIENRQILGTEKLAYFINAQQFFNLVTDADKEMVQQEFNKCIKKKVNGEGVIRIKHDEGIKHVAINYRPVVEQNKVIKLRGTCLDISRIRKSEIALRESENRLKQAEHIAKMGYWNHDYAKNETHFSDEVWNILEKPKSNKPIEFGSFIKFIHPDDRSSVALLFNKSRTSRLPFDFDFRIVSQSGKTKYIKSKGTFVRNQKGDITKAIGTFQDISEIKEKEMALNKAALQLQQIQELSSTGYLEVNLDNNKTYYSNSLVKILELDKSTMQGDQETYNALIHKNDKPTIIKTLNKSFEKRINHNIQYRIVLPSGKLKFVNEILKFQDTENQKGIIATRIIQDITPFKEKELELTKSETRLSEVKKEVLLGTWEYNISKDIYTISQEIKDILNVDHRKKSFKLREVIKHIHPDDYHSVKKVLKASFENKENYTLTYRVILPKSNEIKFLKATGRVLKTPKGDWVVNGILRDITTIKQTKKALSNTAELFNTITNNFFFGTFILQDGKHIYANKKWCDLIGAAPETLINKKGVEDVLKEDTTATLNELLTNWEEFKLTNYTNKMDIHPKNMPQFKAEVFIKEVHYNDAPAFLILVYHTP